MVKWMANKWITKTVGPTIPSIYLDKRLEHDKDYGISLFEPNDDVCMKWLHSKPKKSVVYVSFGSLANLDANQMEEVALALLSSNLNFLWVVRGSEESKVPSDFASKISDKGLIVNWCPQLKVLAHEAIGCFMTHCGWNSTLEALCSGVPLVAMPQWTDQPMNAKFISDIWRVGVRVRVDESGMVTREEIVACLKEVMEGGQRDEFRKNAVKLKEFAIEAVDEGGSSDNNIEELISSLIST